MAHPKGEDPLKPGGTRTQASKDRQLKHERRRHRRAQHRHQVARHFIEELEGEYSYREAVEQLREPIEEGHFPGDRVPNHSTLWKWVKQYREFQEEHGEAPSAFAFLEKKRTGRNRKELDPELEDWLFDQVLQGRIRGVPNQHRAAVREALENGWDVPTKWQIRRYVDEFSVHDRIAAQHGRNAAEVDGAPASTLPTDRPHDMWLIDQTTVPVFIRAVDPTTKNWIAVKPWVSMVLDVRTRVILSYHIVDPFKYGGEPSFTAPDVFGSVLGAALPELSPEETRPHAGYLPDEIRWDQHSVHKSLRPVFEKHGFKLPDTVGEKPHRQGRVERINGTVKHMCDDILGVEHAHFPVGDGDTDEHPKSKRKKAAGDKKRLRKKAPIHVEDLHNLRELREEFGRRVAEYNSREHSFLKGRSPEIRYKELLDKETARSGRDAIFMMEDKMLTVTKAGIDHQENGVRVKFAPESAGAELDIGDEVHCFCDPLQRRLFAEYGGRLLCLQPLEEWADQRSGEEVARRKNRKAAEASEYAEELEKKSLEEEAGPAAHEKAQAALAEETGEDDDDDLPPRNQGLVAHKRAEAKQEIRRRAEEDAMEDVAPSADSLGNPMDEIRLKEEAS